MKFNKKSLFYHSLSLYFKTNQLFLNLLKLQNIQLFNYDFLCDTKVMIFRVIFNNAEEVAS